MCFSLQETYEQRRKDYMGELQKREDEMRSNFIKKVKEKEAELKQEEQEVLYCVSFCHRPLWMATLQFIVF